MKPTAEQQRAIELAAPAGAAGLKIEAFAGTGKTTTLKQIAEAKTNARGLYLAFNRAIKDEAESKFPSSVTCKTAHSLAYGPVGRLYGDRLKGRLTPKLVADTFRVADMGNTSGVGIATYAIRAVDKFCQSGDDFFTSEHLPSSLEKQPDIADAVYRLADRLGQRMDDPKDNLPITHDFYLKKWALTQPRLNFDYILFDEAQDANGVMLSIVTRQYGQKIYVGDRYQQIYSWRGAVNAMEAIDTAHECAITQSFRFGPAIADTANLILNRVLNANVTLRGTDSIKSKLDAVERADAYLFRTNGGLIGTLITLMEKDEGASVAITGSTNDLLALIEGAEKLRSGVRSYLPELACFETWSELCEYSESEIGGDLGPLVRLVSRGDLWKVKRFLEQIRYTKEETADVVLSTVHKAKGREWDTVKLGDDFKPFEEEGFNPEEANLLYVAVTRARKVLDVSECKAYESICEEEQTKVKVYDRYRFAVPVLGKLVRKSTTNDGVEVVLLTTNNPHYPVGSKIWVHAAQCRAVANPE